MSPRTLAAVALVACLSAPAAAEEGPRLPGPPPAIKRITAPAMNLLLALETWQKDAARGACVAAEPTLESDIKSTLARIQAHQDPAERKLAADWWDHEMRPWLVAWTGGVPGVGTYEAIARRRDESLAFLKASEPRRVASTASDAERLELARKMVAYRQRALDDFAYLERLRAMSGCFKSNRLDDLGRPLGLFGGYENWHRLVDPLAVRRLDELRQEMMPPLHDDEARKTLELLRTLPRDQREKRAETVHLGFGVLGRLIEDEPRAAIVAAFAPTYDDPATRDLVAQTAQRVKDTRAELEQALAAELRAMTLSPESSGKEKGIARGIFSGWQGIVHGRATSPLLRDTGHDSGHLEVDGVKYIYTAGTQFEGFDVEYVARDVKPFWRDLPGLPASELCSLTFAKARRYTRGFDRKLNRWVVVYQSPTYPIPCKNR